MKPGSSTSAAILRAPPTGDREPLPSGVTTTYPRAVPAVARAEYESQMAGSIANGCRLTSSGHGAGRGLDRGASRPAGTSRTAVVTPPASDHHGTSPGSDRRDDSSSRPTGPRRPTGPDPTDRSGDHAPIRDRRRSARMTTAPTIAATSTDRQLSVETENTSVRTFRG